MMTDCKNVASVFKALGDENRIRILQMLHGGELCACKLLETGPTTLIQITLILL